MLFEHRESSYVYVSVPCTRKAMHTYMSFLYEVTTDRHCGIGTRLHS